jgi:signal transduction histidine kinase
MMRMSNSNGVSRWLLVLMLVVAVGVFVWGWWLSRREQWVRVPRNREPVLAFAAKLQKELLRLEELHAQHLSRLARAVDVEDQMRVLWECESLVGVLGCSFLYAEGGKDVVHVRVRGVEVGEYPRLTFESSKLGNDQEVLLDRGELLEGGEEYKGWLNVGEDWLLFWLRKSDRELLAVVNDKRRLCELMQQSLEHLLPEAMAGLTKVSLLEPEILRADQQEVMVPHWMQELPTRLGNWQVLAWDDEVLKISYHQPTLIGAMGLALMLALAGLLVDGEQRRAARLAGQRVSFVNRVSHELRTPLTNMLLNLDLVEEVLPEESGGAKRLALVKEEAGRLVRLAENVLTFTRQEQEGLVLQTVECRAAEVVDGVVKQFEASFARREIVLRRRHAGNDGGMWLNADALSQITANLLSNVEKYAPQSVVDVDTLQEESRFVLKVADLGPGIGAGDGERIFAPFVRVDDRVSAGVTGTGLGLSIARELAEKMGGSLRLEKVDKGACFVLELLNGERSRP